MKIQSSIIFTNLVRFLCLAALILLIVNYKLNPNASIIFSIIVLFIFFFSITRHLVLTEEKVIIEYRRVLPFTNKKKVILLNDIVKVELKERVVYWITYLFPGSFVGASDVEKYIFRLKGGSEIEIPTFGKKTEKISFIQKINKMCS